jgi:predicted peroxiredoxin
MISLEGMYDLHVHPAPSIQRRRFTALGAIKFANEERMAGVLFLDHTYNTTMMADTINEMGFQTKAFGSIMLNEAVGGLSPSVVEIALALGTKQIEMPTYSSKAHYDAYGDDQKIFPYKKRVKPIYILDDHGHLIPEVEEIIELVRVSQSFLATGHLSTLEVDAIVARAKEKGLKVMVCGVSTDMPGYPLDAQKKWASDHIFMEHDYMALTDVPHRTTPIGTIVEQIRAVGAERCVLGTDAGNIKLPDNVTSMRDFITRLIEAGITDKEIDLMARRNPRILLGIS